jgi:uroporphyrin-III C-methyltransferase
MPSPESPGFPVVLDLAGRRVLVVGGGEAATANCRLLAASGAEVHVLAPNPAPALARLAGVAVHHRVFVPADLDGADLCYVALENPAEARAVVAAARARGVLVNAVDRPALSNVATPAAPPMPRRQAAGGARPREGRATLVGAGPGDADLLTLAALRAIREADVILYDALVGPEARGFARRDATQINVGKRCGRHLMSQEAINRLIIAHVRAGARVVRLKGGDPFVFGRGGEEAEALRAAGLSIEVIPGVTAALAVAARLGIPLTHRSVSCSLHLLSAHSRDGALPEHDWSALAATGGTLAVYMGARTLPALAERLMAAGMAPSTPAVAMENATLPEERRIDGTLASIGARLLAASLTGPTLALIGEVVGLAAVEPEGLHDAA